MPFITDRISQTNINKTEQPEQPKEINTNFNYRFNFVPENIINSLSDNIIGQKDILQDIENMLWVVKSGIGNNEKPLAVNFLIGNTGVGKTETVRLIAKEIHGSKDNFCRIDMNTLAQEHYSAAITGAPPGYVGSKEGATLFDVDKIEGNYNKPGIVLFDEIEKASNEVIRSILNILDYGILTLSSGNKTINFRNSIIFMTSNIGAKEIIAHRKNIKNWKSFFKIRKNKHIKEYEIINEALENKFDPEFLNRIDWLLLYKNLDNEHLTDLIKLEINKINNKLNPYSIEIKIDSQAINILIDKFDKRYGARDIARIFRTLIEPELAKSIHYNKNCKIFTITNKNNNLCIECK